MQESDRQAAAIIEKLGLTRHPEGGWFREVYRSEEIIDADSLPERFSGSHTYSTSIYFLLESGDFSTFHRIKSDETWHFYLGSPVKLYILMNDGTLQKIILGDNPDAGHVFQWTVPCGLWFGAEVSVPDSFALLGCTVSPGFEFCDLEMATFPELEEKYGRYATLLRRLTRS